MPEDSAALCDGIRRSICVSGGARRRDRRAGGGNFAAARAADNSGIAANPGDARGHKALGKDPARYRGSAEALVRRVIAGETYKGIGKYDLNLEGLPVFGDALGPHGSPTSDSERTMVTSATKHVLAVVISFGGKDGLDRWTQRM